MARRASRFLVLSQLTFFGLLALCVAIEPHFVVGRDEGGVSNFGVTASTRVPYSLAFLLCAVFLLLAAQDLPCRPTVLRRFRRALELLSILNVVVLVSTYPYKIDVAFRDIHIGAGALLLAFEVVLAVWLALEVPARWLTALLVAVQLAGCLVALITLVGVVHLLLVGQVMAGAAFGVLLIETGRQLTTTKG